MCRTAQCTARTLGFFGWSTRDKCTCSLRRLLQHFLKFFHASSSNSPCQSSLFICNSCNFVHNKLPCEACCSEYDQIVRSRVCHFVGQYFATVYLTCSPLDSKQRIAQTRTLAFDCMCVGAKLPAGELGWQTSQTNPSQASTVTSKYTIGTVHT